MGQKQVPKCTNATEFLSERLFGLPATDRTEPCARQHLYYSALEACAVIASYRQILLFGESLCRHVTMAMISVLRADLMMGALKNWEVPEDLNCYGEMQYSEKASPFFMHRSLVLCCLNNTLMTLARQSFTFHRESIR